MSVPPKRWKVQVPDAVQVRELQAALQLARPIAMVLCNRGITAAGAESYFAPKLHDLSDPFVIPGMERAVARIWEAIRREETILIHGDFDTDGITATALLHWVLRENGAKVNCYLPHRIDDGYGVSIESIAKGVHQHTLVLTVDCGITSIEGAACAKARGIDLIVSDHHQPGATLPEAYAVINPKLHSELTGLQGLAGVGVSFKLCHAFLKHGRAHGLGGLQPDLREGLDLVALGTVADIVPLTAENRCLVRHGMQVLAAQRRPGVHALCEIAGLHERLRTEDIAFRLAPRLNAAGRMGDAHDALHLLEATSVVEAHDLARRLDQYNRQRQQEEDVSYQAAKQVIQQRHLADRSCLVLRGDGWHRGVIGIVASRLVQEYNRPTIVVTADSTGGLQGSGRTVAGLNLVALLDCCRDVLHRYGGHPMAVGLALAEDQLEAFAARFEAAVAQACGGPASLLRLLELDGQLTFGDLDDAFFEQLELLQPFGQQNPAPAFQFCRVEARRILNAGANNSRGTLTDMQLNHINFISFGRKPEDWPPGPWDVAGIPEMNVYNGTATPQLQVLDVRPAS